MVATFVPGLELSRRLYFEAVRPLLDEFAPGLAHTAGDPPAGEHVRHVLWEWLRPGKAPGFVADGRAPGLAPCRWL